MKLFSIMILLYPAPFEKAATKVTIAGGLSLEDCPVLVDFALPVVTAPIWCRYRLWQAQRWALGIAPSQPYLRFLKLKFHTRGDSFSIGNLRIEGRSIFSHETSFSSSDLRTPDETAIERFGISFEQFLKSKRSLRDVLDLEKTRIGVRISESHLQNLALTAGINPWLADSQGQLLIRGISTCALCDQPLEGLRVVCFDHAKLLKGLITKSGDRGPFRVCPACLEIAENVAQTAEVYEEERVMAKLPLPHFVAGVVTEPAVITMSQALTSEATAAIAHGEESVLWNSGGSLTIPPHEERALEFFIVQFSIVREISVYVKAGRFSLIGHDGIEMAGAERSDGLWVFQFAEPQITQTISVTVKALDDEVEISRIQLLYIITEFPLETPAVIANPPAVSAPVANIQAQYSSGERTVHFSFPRANVSKFQLEVVVDRNFKVPISFYFAAYADSQLVYSQPFIVPELENGKKIWYVLDEMVSADSVKIFFVDRWSAIKPHIVRLSLE
jgi:hypothetical protein